MGIDLATDDFDAGWGIKEGRNPVSSRILLSL
jgi:hypothetical protein